MRHKGRVNARCRLHKHVWEIGRRDFAKPHAETVPSDDDLHFASFGFTQQVTQQPRLMLPNTAQLETGKPHETKDS